jgi:putative ABC transport system ATP-binding protein
MAPPVEPVAPEAPREPIISVRDLTRVFGSDERAVTALNAVSMDIMPGEFLAITGRSGSGKTTLLNLMAGLDRPTSGTVLFEGSDLASLSDAGLVGIRRTKVGFVFQSFGLMHLLSAYENVELPLHINGVPWRERRRRSLEVLELVGLGPRVKHRPYELSGGEQQRVAIARAVVTRPPIVLADEPTGELDSVNARAIFRLFEEMVRTQGLSVVTVTHDSTLLAMADEVKEMRDGGLHEAGVSAGRFV